MPFEHVTDSKNKQKILERGSFIKRKKAEKIEPIGTHNHLQRGGSVGAAKVMTIVGEKASTTKYSPQQISSEATGGISESVQAGLPSVPSNSEDYATNSNISNQRINGAFGKILDGTQLRGCFFHYGQCLWRQIQGSPDLLGKCTDIGDPNFALDVRKLMSLAFIRPQDVMSCQIVKYWLKNHL
ncbi:hypothetical protein ILUMI_05070 [Ignelater luminosus]|uniref:Uncharacterized protein n=1 Tax=Ignelater luminosus TaxID=2038154 RepID=A0A8K0DD15_IGNLU|nr:hypothetical protein ILUMI_05070 [Ignelater luminosus]